MVFQVQACHNARVAMTTVPGLTDTNMYEIILGAAMNSLVISC